MYMIRTTSEKSVPVRPAEPEAAREFNSLAERWRTERPRGVDVAQMADTAAYREIIAMGVRAIRPMLIQLRQRPEHWIYALYKITGENPVPPEAEGNLKEMAEAWIRWGKERGYLGELD
jgi:hypothetical protein